MTPSMVIPGKTENTIRNLLELAIMLHTKVAPDTAAASCICVFLKLHSYLCGKSAFN